MDTQNTPVHVRLWHRDFWTLILSSLLASMSAYMFVPTLPLWLMGQERVSAADTGLAMGIFALGLFVLGPWCSHLVQCYRRNQVYILSVLLMALMAFPLSIFDAYPEIHHSWMVVLLRALMGAFYGLAQMSLSSTLILDVTESFQRTEANYAAAWFGRFALSLGPLLGLALYQTLGFNYVVYASMGAALLAVVCVATVRFQFKTPYDYEMESYFSLDRFFLPRATWLFLAQMMVMVGVGLVLSLPLKMTFYALLMAGFFLSILAERYAFADADLKSQMTTGLILIAMALLLMEFRNMNGSAGFIAPVLLGCGVGLVGSRFLLFFVKFSGHCERGTSQSTFMLSWESGLAIGLGLGYACFNGEPHKALYWAMVITWIFLIIYNFWFHPWYMKNKNR